MKISLWLMAPPSVHGTLQDQIVALSDQYNGPVFPPHVTVIGGIDCHSEAHLKQLCQTLQQDLTNFGGIPCRFKRDVLSMYNKDDALIWNQASVSTMSREKKFMHLIERSKKWMAGLKGEFHFRQPLGEPHYSYFYARDGAPPCSQVTPVPDFIAQQLAVWITDPATVDGVPLWKEIDRIDLCPNKSDFSSDTDPTGSSEIIQQ